MATNEDGFVRLWRWDRDTLQFFDIDTPITFSCRFRARDRLRCSSFNYTGTKFAVAGDDGFVYVFSTIQVPTAHEGQLSSTESQDGSARPAAGRGRRKFANALFPDKNSQLLTQAVVPIGTLEGHMGSVTDLAYSHDGQRILSGCQDGTARIWTFDKETKKWSSIVLDLKVSIHDQVPIVKPSTPNSTVMSRTTSINQAQSPQPSPTVANNQDQHEIGTLMPSIDDMDDNRITLPETTAATMDVDPPMIPTAIDPPKVSMIAWSADDRWCIIASNQGEIRVYYAYNGQPACILKGHEGEIYALDNHPLDPSTILSAGYDGNVILWDVQKQKVITCTNHVGRTFTDCKFSKDAMKYAITDEEGHCTLFGIGGLDKDYEQVRSWERGQYFMSDYQALRHFADGSFVDDPTQQHPYAMPFSPIIDLQGVAYPNQKKLGYGRSIPTTSETFELEDTKRSACYDQEEEELRLTKLIVLPSLDRATVARKRRDFVRFDDDEEADIASANNIQFQFPPPVPPVLLPDDSADEDYHDDDDANNAAYASSGNSSDEGGSDEFVVRDDDTARLSHHHSSSRHDTDQDNEDDDDDDDDGPMTRSRASHLPSRTLSRPSNASNVRRVTRRGRGRGAGSARGGLARGSRGSGRASASTRKRRVRSDDDEEEQPVRARARRRVAEIPSYVESDFESEEEFVDVESDVESISEAGPSNTQQRYNIDNNNLNNNVASSTNQEDRKGKRKLRSSTINSDDDFINTLVQQQFYNNNNLNNQPSSSMEVTASSTSSSAPIGRATRSRTNQPEYIPPPPKPITTTTNNKASLKKVAKQRDIPRDLSVEEIKEHEPIPWITNTERSLHKYLPQLGDIVVILTEGHKQYLRSSDMKHFFDSDKHGVIDKHEPVLFAKINHISWHVGPPAFCKLKLSMLALPNLPQVLQHRVDPVWVNSSLSQQVIEYTDEDGCPEFIVLWERFLASMTMFQSLRIGQKVEALYDEGQYTGTISSTNRQGLYWKQAQMPSPWAFYHVLWDDANSTPEDMCPWELVPAGEDFRQRYDVAPSLTAAQIKRAKDTLNWLSNLEDFFLYVHQVNYYDYPPYLSMIAYPICLDMIQERLNNNFYRSVDASINTLSGETFFF
jgi:WD40 repeat protein